MPIILQEENRTEFDANRTLIFYMSGLVVLLPGLFIGLVSSWHSNMFKTFLRHPSIFVLPVFTPFTFTSSKKTCCANENEEEGHIRFSVKASLCNLLISFLTSAVFVFAVFAHHPTIIDRDKIAYGIYFLFLPFTGSLLSLLFLYNARPTTNQFYCCCSCKAAIEYGVYKPDSPAEYFGLRINADGSEETCVEVDQEEEERTEEAREEEQGDGEQGQLQEHGGQEEEYKNFDPCSNLNGTEECCSNRYQEES